MNADLATMLPGWGGFFAAAAGASAVLLGLVFIGLTIHLEGKKERPALVPLAVGSATTLFYPVIISLVLLMPPAQPWLPTGALAVVAVFAAISASAPIVQSDLRVLWFKNRKAADWVRYLVPAVAALVLVAAAFLMLLEPAGAIYATAIVIVLYLVVGTQNAWNLLLAGRFEVGAWSVTRSDNDANDGT